MIAVGTPGWSALGARLRRMAYAVPALGNLLLAKKVADITTAALKDEAPVGPDTQDWQGNVTHTGGTLRDSLKAQVRLEGGQLTIGFSAVDYAKYVIGGTSAHLIYPAYKQALAFWADGTLIVARQVEHPGTQPNPFQQRAYERTAPEIRALLRAAGRDLFVSFAAA